MDINAPVVDVLMNAIAEYGRWAENWICADDVKKESDLAKFGRSMATAVNSLLSAIDSMENNPVYIEEVEFQPECDEEDPLYTGKWNINISGFGPNHNGDEYDGDADRIMDSFIKYLSESGHTIFAAKMGYYTDGVESTDEFVISSETPDDDKIIQVPEGTFVKCGCSKKDDE